MVEKQRRSDPRGVLRIEALAYQCLRHIRQRIRPFQLLVGANASGKSTFLDVIGFLGDLARSDLDTAIRGNPRLDIPLRAPDPQQLTWHRDREAFELAVELAIPDSLRTSTNGSRNGIRYEIRVEVTEEPKITIENLWLTKGPLEEKPSERPRLFPAPKNPPKNIVRLPKAKTPKGRKKVISRGQAGQAYFNAETSGWNAPFALPGLKSALANLPEDRDRFPVALWLRDLLINGVQRLSLTGEAMRRPCPPTLQAGYLPDGSNIPYVVGRLKEKDPDQFQRWIAHVQEALPNIEDISTAERPEDRHRYLVLRYRTGLETPSWLISDGTLRTLALTLLAYSRDLEDRIILVEEPENGIHPRAVETVFQALSSVYGAQVLLATHSPVILGMARLQDLLCFTLDEDGASDIVSGLEHPRLRQWKGSLDLSDLFAAGILG
jgi:predicted ATPase